METGPQITHRAIIADKGYDSDDNRETARMAGAIPVIPYRSNRRNIPKHFAVALYRGRARIEQTMGKLKPNGTRCYPNEAKADGSFRKLLRFQLPKFTS